MKCKRVWLTFAAAGALCAAVAAPAGAGVPVAFQQVSATNAGLPANNTLNGFASAPVGSSSFGGSFSDTDGTNSYSGDIVCVNFDGTTHNASFILSIATPPANAPQVAGAVYWVHDGASDASSDGQRNRLLTSRQLAKLGGACPDPNSPPSGHFKALSSGDIVVAVMNNNV
jgi:hypothetical protein